MDDDDECPDVWHLVPWSEDQWCPTCGCCETCGYECQCLELG